MARDQDHIATTLTVGQPGPRTFRSLQVTQRRIKGLQRSSKYPSITRHTGGRAPVALLVPVSSVVLFKPTGDAMYTVLYTVL